MRRITQLAAIILLVPLLLAGCGEWGSKSSEDVVKDLDKVIGKLDSYAGVGRMMLHTGQQEAQEYDVEVWYQAPSYYRISLKNAKKDITQIVLRNDEGVFVLTPHLNKMFRFQSDWPENSGQVYLYQSLVQSIVMDEDRQFTTDKDAYVFDVAANYQNGMLARQKVWLNKKDLRPKHVEVSDDQANVLMVMDFSQFEFGRKFDKDSFDMQRNMTSWKLESLPAMAQSGANQAANGQASSSEQAEFGVIEPTYMPQGVKKLDMAELNLGEEKGVVIRYSGKYNYSIAETRPQSRTVMTTQSAQVMDLGYTIGVITGDEMKTLMWTHDGVEFRLTTADLPDTEMIRVAQSVQGQIGK
jgi:outer membrane lipoprotein-sorting protein